MIEVQFSHTKTRSYKQVVCGDGEKFHVATIAPAKPPVSRTSNTGKYLSYFPDPFQRSILPYKNPLLRAGCLWRWRELNSRAK